MMPSYASIEANIVLRQYSLDRPYYCVYHSGIRKIGAAQGSRKRVVSPDLEPFSQTKWSSDPEGKELSDPARELIHFSKA
jgi:hypothetical protein